MWEPNNIMVVSQEWHNHHDDWYWQEGEDDTTYCDVNSCKECPRYGDDCDGNIDRMIAYYERQGDEYVYYDENECELFREPV